MSMEKIQGVRTSYPTIIDKIEKYGTTQAVASHY